MKPLTDNESLKIGQILRAARIRAGKSSLAIANDVGVSDSLVRQWERDIRGIGSWWKKDDMVDRAFTAYDLTAEERSEVLKRISLRKQEYASNRNPAGEKPQKKNHQVKSGDQVSAEMVVFSQLMALSREQRQRVLEMVRAQKALTGR